MTEAGPVSEIKPSPEPIEFTPAKLPLNEIVQKISHLENGDILHLANAAEVIRIGDKNILIDQAILGRELKEKGKLIPPGTSSADALKSQKEEDGYSHFMIEVSDYGPKSKNSQVSRIGKALGPLVDAVLVSHLDADHFDFELIRTILTANPRAEAYGPLGWKHFLFQYNRGQLPEKLLSRIKSLRPQRENKTEAFSQAKIADKVSLTSIDVPHLGAPQFVEMTQGFLLEADGERIMALTTDPALSPETIIQVKKIHREKPLTHITLAGPTFNPETLYGVIGAKKANWLREKIEEGLSHSAKLSLVLEAVTQGQVPIDIVHHGFYFRSSSERGYLNNRLPAQAENQETKAAWLKHLDDFVSDLIDQNQPQIDRLDRLALALKHNRKKFLKDAKFRLKFANKIVNWINKEKVPQPAIDFLGMPQPGQVIKAGSSAR